MAKEDAFPVNNSESGVYVETPFPEYMVDETVEQTRRRSKWENDDYICRGHILNAKDMAEDASIKKFLVSDFNNYKMIDSRPIMEQYNELLRILGQFSQHNLRMDETISVLSVIDKLPPSWKNSKHTLKHQKEEMSLVQLGSHLRIEKSLRVQENDKLKGKDVVSSSSVNMEDRKATKTNDKKGKRKDDDVAWWIDSGATAHAYKDRGWFKVLQPVDDGSILHMGNESSAPIVGVGSVVLEFTSAKIINLSNVLLRTDRGGEYIDPSYFQSVGIIHETIAPYTPQQNGVSERKNRVLKEMVNSMLSYSGLSDGFWGEAVLTACYLLNRVPNKRNKVTPYELWFYVIAPNDFISVNTVIESRDAIFDETRFFSIPRPKEIIPSTSGTNKETESFEMTPDELIELRKSKRVRKSKLFGLDFQLYLIEGSRDEVSTLYPYCFNVEDDPKIFDEAIKSQDVAFWKEAINDEMDSIMGNNTWVLADLPPGCKPLGCKWIFKKKMKVDGTIEKFKARLVIQGFRQRQCIDYFDTYAPVPRISTIRLLIALAAIHNLVIYQMNVKTTFLNGDLDEVVYMKQPEGFIMPGNEHKQVDLTKEFLSSRFSMKDMGKADVILGIRITRENKGISISQSHYIEKLLKKFNCFDCTPVSTPMDPSVKLMLNTRKAVFQLEYSKVIGCLMYAMTITRPNIAYAMEKLSSFTSNPSTHH
ncbi:UNVERIFIED_CONTAM: Retrovirus-related Pol polyprotein from transposon TNT 1-94 [Sesamum radiatum]|uniref:Retrovirus-related Pol polyprotein from transposon TNT 1-94 n=1 Tax=Sesamum radiatum TaxID=300843 RepID=A0AAW2TX90_SESRA